MTVDDHPQPPMMTIKHRFSSLWRFLWERSLWIPLLLWILLYSWRPWVLGFYYDDWGMLFEQVHHGPPFSLERLHWFWSIHYFRPMTILPYFIFGSLFGQSPFGWHTAIIILTAGATLVFYYFLSALLRLYGYASSLAPAIGASLLLCAPWMVGVSAWPTMIHSSFDMALFSCMGLLWLRSWDRGESAVFWPAVCFLLQGGFYEVFSLQFLPFFIFALSAGVWRKVPLQKLAFSLAGVGMAQGALIAYKLLFPWWYQNTGWFHLLWSALTRLPVKLFRSASEIRVIMLGLAAGLVAMAGVAMGRRAQQIASPETVRAFWIKNAGWVVGCGLGVFLACWVMAYGGRTVNGSGTFARTTIGISFWLLIFFTFIAYWLETLSIGWRRLAFTLTGLALFLLSLATVKHTLDFATAWRMEQTIARNAPIEAIRHTSKNAVILYQGPIHENGVYIFYGDYTISGVMNWMYPDLKQPSGHGIDPYGNGWKLFLVQADYDTVWNGKTLRQRNRDYPVKDLWFWNYKTHSLQKLSPPITIPQLNVSMP